MNCIRNNIVSVIFIFVFSNVHALEFKKSNFSYSNIDLKTSIFNTLISQNLSKKSNNLLHKFLFTKKKTNLISIFYSNKNEVSEYVPEDGYNLHLNLSKIKQDFKYLLILFIIVSLSLTTSLIFVISKLKNNNIKKTEVNKEVTFQKHIKQKEKEILATLIAVSAQQEELIETLQVVEDLKNKKQDPSFQKIYMKLKKITKSSSNLNLIFQKLESQYSYFSTSIKNAHPNLTKNDIRNCILLRLGLSLKDSAELLNVSVHAIKIARQRIKKKINYTDHVNLKEYLDTFQNHQSLPTKV